MRYLLLALVAGCSARALPLPERGAPDLASDAATVSSDLSVCGDRHHRGAVVLDAITSLDGSDSYGMEAAARVLVRFSLRSGCDLPGDLTVELSPGNATTAAAVTAYAWLGTVGCGAVLPVTRELTIASSHVGNPRLFLHDATTPNGAALTLHAIPGPVPPCGAVAFGGACVADCDCTTTGLPGALCLVGGDGQARCGVPCHSDTQCRGTPGSTCLGAPFYACGESARCRLEGECLREERLEQCHCTRPYAAPAPPACGCDTDCPTGSLCTEAGVCTRTCTGPWTCADFRAGEGAEACLDGVCVQYI